MEYIRELNGKDDGGCFLCRYRDDPDADAENLVLRRSERTLILLNRYPYTNGHLLIAPAAHVGEMEAVDEQTLTEMSLCIRDAQRVLRAAVRCDGFNIGMNLGRCAGAGLPDHLHYHVVPRWNGDTNFMSVVGNSRVIPQSLEDVRDAYLAEASKLAMR